MQIKKRKNKILPVYIFCYFGSERSVRAIRKSAFEIQVDWFLDQDCRIHLYIYLQDKNYSYNFCSDRVHYIVVDSPANPSYKTHVKAINACYSMFYASNYDWGVFANNDAVLYDHNFGGGIFTHMLDNSELWKQLDCWHPINPRNEPFNYLWKEEKELFENNIVFRRAGINMNGSIYALANFRKRYGLEFYDSYDYKQGYDMRLMADMLAGGMKCYKCWSVVMKELANVPIVPGSEVLLNRTKLMVEDKLKIAEVYKHKGLKTKKGKGGRPVFDAREFYKQCCNYEKQVCFKK